MRNRLAVLSLVAFAAMGVPAGAYDFSAIDTLLADSLTSAFRGGVVCLVAKDDQLIYSSELGTLNRSSQEQVASVTKTFSGALILALCDAGLISLDDSVGRHLPVFTQNGKNRFTIRNCFSHTAGWDSDDNRYLNSRRLSLQQVADSIAVNYPFAYEPGTAFSYTGVAMQIAGAMAERAAGRPWDSLFAAHIAEKCSLTNTEYCLPSASNPMIAGGLCSTPDDIMKLASMILNKGLYHGRRVVSEAAIAEMWEDQTNRVPQISSPYPSSPPWNNPYHVDTVFYGVGNWLDVQNPSTGYVEQISGDGAFGTVFWVDRCHGVTGVIFTASMYGLTWPTEYRIIDIVREQVGGGCSTTQSIGLAPVGPATGLVHSEAVDVLGRVLHRSGPSLAAGVYFVRVNRSGKTEALRCAVARR